VDELPPLSERGPGGLGIFLIRKTMDEFHYRRTPDGWNELTLSIYKPSSDAAP
jgi:anti-sigma regulatory factor (Ser/Thr protein kinase)